MIKKNHILEKKIELFGGTIIYHIEDIQIPGQTIAIVDNNPDFGIRLAMARSLQLSCVTSEFIHHCCYFKRLMDQDWYVPSYFIANGVRIDLRFVGRPFEFCDILVLSDSVHPFLRVKYMLNKANAYTYFGTKYIQRFEEGNHVFEFEYAIYLSDLSESMIRILKRMNAHPVNEQFMIDSIIRGFRMNLEPKYCPEYYLSIMQDNTDENI